MRPSPQAFSPRPRARRSGVRTFCTPCGVSTRRRAARFPVSRPDLPPKGGTMADPTTILEVADLEQANDLAAQTAANTALVNATAALAAAQSQQQELAAQLQTLQQLEADIRRQLAATAMPADGEALLEQLGQAIVDTRATQAQLATAEAQAGQSRLDVETAQAALAASTTAAGVAASAREQALHDDTERAAWKSAVAAAPLKDVKAQATTAANTANEPLHSA